MSGQVSESQIYLFLADYGSNWRADADKLDKEDGDVTKYEFKKFIAEEMDGWNGVDISKLSHSVIDNFFAKLDTNDVGSNFNRLNNKELDDMESNIKAYQVLNDYIADKFKNDYPSNVLNTKYGNSWKWELSDGLTPVIEQCISEKNTDEAAIKAALDNVYPQSCALATAQCCAAQYAEDDTVKNLISDLTENYGYKINDDRDLQHIIRNWIENNLTGTMDANAINNGIKSVVDGYLATAGLGNGNPDAVKDLGYNPAKLNEIQKAQLNKEVKTALYGNIDYNITDRDGNTIDLGAYSEQYSQAVEAFAANYQIPSDVTTQEGMSQFEAILNSIRTNIKTQFENSDAFKKLKNSILLEETYLGVDQNSGFIQFLKDKGLPDEQINALLPKIKDADTCKSEYPEYYKKYCEIMESIKKGEPTYLNDDGTINYGAIDSKLLELFQPEIDAAIARQAALDAINNASYSCGNRTIIDKGFSGNYYDMLNGNIGSDTSALMNLISDMYSVLAGTKGIDKTALETAYNEVKTLYTQMLSALYTDCANNHADRGYNKRGNNRNPSIVYKGVEYKASSDQDDDCKGKEMGGGTWQGNSGLYLKVRSHDSRHYWLTVDTGKIWETFKNFYRAALG